MFGATATFAPTKVTNEAAIENSHGAQVAFNKSGSCVYHPDILLRKKTITGWKVLSSECQRCKIEWEDRRRAALNKRSTSSSYLSARMYDRQASGRNSMHQLDTPPSQNQISYPQQQPQHEQPQHQQRHDVFQKNFQQPPPEQQYQQYTTPFQSAQTELYSNQQNHHHSPVLTSTYSQPTLFQRPPAPLTRPLSYSSSSSQQQHQPPHPPQQPLEIQFPGQDYQEYGGPFQPAHSSPPSPPPRPFVVPVPTTSTHPVANPIAAQPLHQRPLHPSSRPWVSQPQMAVPPPEEIADEDVEVDEADEDDVEMDLLTAFTNDDVETILAIMREYQGSPPIQGVACKCLLRMCNRDDSNARTVLYCGAKPLVEDAYHFFKDSDANVAGDGFVLLELFKRLEASNDANANTNTIGPVDSIPEEPVPEFQPQPARSSLADLPSVDKRSEESAKHDMNMHYKRDDIEGIIRTMRNHMSCASIQGLGAKAIWRLGHRYHKFDIVFRCGGKAVIEDALHYFSEADDDVAGYGQILLDFFNRPEEVPEETMLEAATTESARLPLSSLPKVDPRVEKIAVDDMRYFGHIHDANHVIAVARWYPRSSLIQGRACEILFSVLLNSDSFDDLLVSARRLVKDALYYFAEIDDNVKEYGSKLLDVIEPHHPSLDDIEPYLSNDAFETLDSHRIDMEESMQNPKKDDEPQPSTEVPACATTTAEDEESKQMPSKDDTPQPSTETPADSNVKEEKLGEATSSTAQTAPKQEPDQPLTPATTEAAPVETTAACEVDHPEQNPDLPHTVVEETDQPLTNAPTEVAPAETTAAYEIDQPEQDPVVEQAEQPIVPMLPPLTENELAEASEPEVAIEPISLPSSAKPYKSESKLEMESPVVHSESPGEMESPVAHSESLDVIHEAPHSITRSLNIRIQEVKRATKALPVAPALRSIVRNTKSLAANVTVSLASGDRPTPRPLSQAFKMMNRKNTTDNGATESAPQRRHPMASSFTKAEPTGAYSRTLTSKNLVAVPSVDPELEKNAVDELHDRVTQEDVKGVLEVMRCHPGSLLIQMEGCVQLWSLCNRPNKAAVAVNSGGLDVVEDALFYFGNSATDDSIFGYGTLLVDLFKDLSADYSPSSDASSLDPRVQVLLEEILESYGSYQDVDSIVRIMQRYTQSSVQVMSLTALLGLANDDDGWTAAMNSSAKEAIEAAIRAHDDDETVNDLGSALLNLLQDTTDKAEKVSHAPDVPTTNPQLNQATFVHVDKAAEQPKVLPSKNRPPLSSLGHTDPLVERIAANSIRSLDGNSHVENVLALMQRHPSSLLIQAQGVQKLWQFCYAYDKVDDVLRSKAREIVEDAAFYFGSADKNIAEYAPMITNLFS